MRSYPARTTAGSSPLTRGKLFLGFGTQASGRLIPAHAGKTFPWIWNPSFWPAHPRSRGENIRQLVHFFGGNGSSPLTRGKPRRERRGGLRPGLIPAHAGKTSPRTAWRATTRAHPRSRGENALGVAICGVVTGSSPLTRGKPRQCRRAPSRLRLIPAHAGKTARSGTRRRRAGAHPRSRGENGAARRIGTAAGGSSPLTRGKRRQERISALATRLIPAHAGKTDVGWDVLVLIPAHPRSRGENDGRCVGPARQCGSSPLTRGKRGRVRH